MKTLDQGHFDGKKVLVRCDFNVPLDSEKNITDDTRIRECLPTMTELLEKGASLILMSHLGRPAGTGFEEAFSLQPVATYLEEILGKHVIYSHDVFTDKTVEMAKALKPGEVMLLENLRFIKGETKGDENFAKYLASLGDAYVNDAFGSAHRAHSSTSIIAQFFPNEKYAGKLMAHEVENLEKLLHGAARPFTAVIGGSKVSSKIDVLTNLVEKVDNLVIGGGMAYTFVKALGGKIGLSLCEDDKIDVAKKIMSECEQKGVKLYLPTDTVCADKFENNANRQIVSTMNIPDGWEGMDIGPNTIDNFKSVIKTSKSVLWNGPVGVFEMPNFQEGTLQIGRAIGEATHNGAYSAVGGGDSVAAANQLNLAKDLSYVSTGGGAMLEYLEGKALPGVMALE